MCKKVVRIPKAAVTSLPGRFGIVIRRFFSLIKTVINGCKLQAVNETDVTFALIVEDVIALGTGALLGAFVLVYRTEKEVIYNPNHR